MVVASPNPTWLTTKGKSTKDKGRWFLPKGGRLVAPYPANSFDMVKYGMIEVEKVRITEGPNKGLEGWTQIQCLHRLLTIFAL